MLLNYRYFSIVLAIICASYSAYATDYTLTSSSSPTTLSDNDTVTITDHFGADNNTTSNLITSGGDNVAISISGTLQGDDDLFWTNDNTDNLTVTISEGAHVVARGTRAFDIDGNSEIATDVTFTNSGTIYAAERFAISAQDAVDAVITNTATGLLTASDRTLLFNDSDNLSFTNYGNVTANNDNITYRTNVTVARSASAEGYALAATSANALTIVNEGTIATNGQRTIFLKSSTNSDVTNTGTI